MTVPFMFFLRTVPTIKKGNGIGREGGYAGGRSHESGKRLPGLGAALKCELDALLEAGNMKSKGRRGGLIFSVAGPVPG